MLRALTYGLLAFLVFVHVMLVGKLSTQHENLRQSSAHEQLFSLPSSILKIASLDYKGIVSDFLFIKGIAYIGGFAYKKGSGTVQLDLNDAQWHSFYNIMDVATDLDPYFQDPYYISNAFLPWDAAMARETNSLLDKGSRFRSWDWTLPFFSGFNSFYFLEENDRASEKLMEASRRPGASPVLASLASKLAYKANKTESSILFLQELIDKTDDEKTKRIYEMRIEAFKGILVLQRAVDEYRLKYKSMPRNLDDLVKRRVLGQLPKEPYGGKYYIDHLGAVRTSNESLLVPYQKKKQPTSPVSPHA